jgi:predicted CXXCH cytochrome family protein
MATQMGNRLGIVLSLIAPRSKRKFAERTTTVIDWPSLRHGVTACVLSGLLIALAYFLGPAGAEITVGNFGLHQAAAAEPVPKPAEPAEPAKATDSTGSASQESLPNDDGGEEEEEEEFLDPMGPNAACYVCHMTFIFEELSKVHLKEKVTCIECHGISAAHANDEYIGATKPDKTYKRCQVNAACRKCHEEHDAKPEKVIAQWIEIGAPKQKPVCTDCHGTHKIERPESEEQGGGDDATDASDGKTKK